MSRGALNLMARKNFDIALVFIPAILVVALCFGGVMLSGCGGAPTDNSERTDRQLEEARKKVQDAK